MKPNDPKLISLSITTAPGFKCFIKYLFKLHWGLTSANRKNWMNLSGPFVFHTWPDA